MLNFAIPLKRLNLDHEQIVVLPSSMQYLQIAASTDSDHEENLLLLFGDYVINSVYRLD